MADVQQIFANGELLYAGTPAALYQKDGQHGGWRRVLSPAGTMLADRNISSLALDSSNRLWVGYFDRGLDLFAPSLSSATHMEDDNIFCFNRILPNATTGTAP